MSNIQNAEAPRQVSPQCASIADSDRPDYSVVLPAHNEADNLSELIAEIRLALEGKVNFEVVVTDDGSSDGSLDVLREISRGFGKLRVVRHLNQCGQSAALMTCIRAARAPWIVTLDSDGQNDPADIPALIDVLNKPGQPENLKLIAGHRVNRKDTQLKRMSSRIANRVRGGLLHDDTPDTGCGLKLFEREIALRLPFFDHFHRFLPALIIRGGGAVVSVAVNHRPRNKGRSHYGLHNRLWVGIIDMLGVMWLQRRAKLPIVAENESTED